MSEGAAGLGSGLGRDLGFARWVCFGGKEKASKEIPWLLLKGHVEDKTGTGWAAVESRETGYFQIRGPAVGYAPSATNKSRRVRKKEAHRSLGWAGRRLHALA